MEITSNENSSLLSQDGSIYSPSSSEKEEEGVILQDTTATGNTKTTVARSKQTLRNKFSFWAISSIVITVTLAAVVFLRPQTRQWDEEEEHVTVAFVGNSMFYFNDFPRFFQVFSQGRKQVSQNSCLHGGGSIPSLLLEGNSMYPQFGTPKAVITKHRHHTIYDYGACTVEQLLTGIDLRLDDPGYARPTEANTTNLNPCREDAAYLSYAKNYFANEQPAQPYWDFVMLNDNTRDPARAKTREHSLQFLERFYVSWLLETRATPVFLWTHAYMVESIPTRNMTGLTDVANFTSLTGVGYKECAKLLASYLPEEQTPRIAPVGLAFLMVYEEQPEFWKTLFHSDHIHASPSGTFLQGCVVYYTLFGEMPPKDYVVRQNMESLWKTARMMQHAFEPPNPFPTRETAEYLYHIAERLMVNGEIPKSYIDYQNGEAAFEG
jgi:hypothetical protein